MLWTKNFEMTDRKNRKHQKQWKQTKNVPKVVPRAAADFVRQLKIGVCLLSVHPSIRLKMCNSTMYPFVCV